LDQPGLKFFTHHHFKKVSLNNQSFSRTFLPSFELTFFISRSTELIMGAYKYVEELYKKKQSDVLRFLMRVRLVFQA